MAIQPEQSYSQITTTLIEDYKPEKYFPIYSTIIQREKTIVVWVANVKGYPDNSTYLLNNSYRFAIKTNFLQRFFLSLFFGVKWTKEKRKIYVNG